MDYVNSCKKCGHSLFWSVGHLGKVRLFVERLFRLRTRYIPAKRWDCSVGRGEGWDVPACNCRHSDHKLDRV